MLAPGCSGETGRTTPTPDQPLGNTAVFKGIEPEEICEFLGGELTLGERKVVTYMRGMSEVERCLLVERRQAAQVAVSVHQVYWAYGVPERKVTRETDQERVILGNLIERVLRETKGRLVSCTIPGLDNVQAVPVAIHGHFLDVYLTGASREEVLRELREAINDVPPEFGRFPRHIRDEEKGVSFFLYPLRDDGSFSTVRLLYLIRDEGHHLRLRLASWTTATVDEETPRVTGDALPHGKDPKPIVYVARQFMTYILGKLKNCQVVQPDKVNS
jgi:hypothetical protein